MARDDLFGGGEDREWGYLEPDLSSAVQASLGAFYRTALEKHLRDLRASTVVVCGCNCPNCPRTTIYEASERDLRIAFIPDATSGVYERGLRELENIGVKLASVNELPRKLTAEFSNV